MRKVLIALFAGVLYVGLAGCMFDADKVKEQAEKVVALVEQTCGEVVRIADIVDVVTAGSYAGATVTARVICSQFEARAFGLYSGSKKDKEKDCIAVVNGVCVRSAGK